MVRWLSRRWRKGENVKIIRHKGPRNIPYNRHHLLVSHLKDGLVLKVLHLANHRLVGRVFDQLIKKR